VCSAQRKQCEVERVSVGGETATSQARASCMEELLGVERVSIGKENCQT